MTEEKIEYFGRERTDGPVEKTWSIEVRLTEQYGSVKQNTKVTVSGLDCLAVYQFAQRNGYVQATLPDKTHINLPTSHFDVLDLVDLD